MKSEYKKLFNLYYNKNSFLYYLVWLIVIFLYQGKQPFLFCRRIFGHISKTEQGSKPVQRRGSAVKSRIIIIRTGIFGCNFDLI